MNKIMAKTWDGGTFKTVIRCNKYKVFVHYSWRSLFATLTSGHVNSLFHFPKKRSQKLQVFAQGIRGRKKVAASILTLWMLQVWPPPCWRYEGIDALITPCFWSRFDAWGSNGPSFCIIIHVLDPSRKLLFGIFLEANVFKSPLGFRYMNK